MRILHKFDLTLTCPNSLSEMFDTYCELSVNCQDLLIRDDPRFELMMEFILHFCLNIKRGHSRTPHNLSRISYVLVENDNVLMFQFHVYSIDGTGPFHLFNIGISEITGDEFTALPGNNGWPTLTYSQIPSRQYNENTVEIGNILLLQPFSDALLALGKKFCQDRYSFQYLEHNKEIVGLFHHNRHCTNYGIVATCNIESFINYLIKQSGISDTRQPHTVPRTFSIVIPGTGQ